MRLRSYGYLATLTTCQFCRLWKSLCEYSLAWTSTNASVFMAPMATQLVELTQPAFEFLCKYAASQRKTVNAALDFVLTELAAGKIPQGIVGAFVDTSQDSISAPQSVDRRAPLGDSEGRPSLALRASNDIVNAEAILAKWRVKGRALHQRRRRAAKRPASGYWGVIQHRPGRWRAYVTTSAGQEQFGAFETPEEAAQAHDEIVLALHNGVYASCITNFARDGTPRDHVTETSDWVMGNLDEVENLLKQAAERTARHERILVCTCGSVEGIECQVTKFIGKHRIGTTHTFVGHLTKPQTKR